MSSVPTPAFHPLRKVRKPAVCSLHSSTCTFSMLPPQMRVRVTQFNMLFIKPIKVFKVGPTATYHWLNAGLLNYQAALCTCREPHFLCSSPKLESFLFLFQFQRPPKAGWPRFSEETPTKSKP